jgi:hypothetical protein
MSVRGHLLALSLVLVTTVALTTGAVAVVGPSHVGDGVAAAPTLATGGPCAGGLLPSAYSGTVVISNSTFIPVTPVNYSYFEEIASSVNGGVPYAYACDLANGSVSPTPPSGTFSLSILPTPVESCGPEVGGDQYCNTTSGPYVGVSVAPAPPYPTGLEPRVTRSGDAFHIEYYRDLVGVTLAPATPALAWSTGAVVPYVATSVSSLGGPSPDPPSYTWTVTGAGWSLVGTTRGAEANVTAVPGAAQGNLSVTATLETASGTEVTPPASAALTAVATTVVNATVTRTTVDEWQPLAVTLNGSGADGYVYRATVTPGLGGPPVSDECAVTAGAGGTGTIACSVPVTYSADGTAAPSVTLSNGDSSASVALPNVTVASPPVVAFASPDLAGYVGTPIPVVVTAESGTGLSPYAQACLADGLGRATCTESPGPTWTFTATYPAPGVYSARAWAVDAAGENVSTAAPVIVADPLGVELMAPPAPVPDGVATTLLANVSGGLVPARAWWNASDLAVPFAVVPISADGPISAPFDPPVQGSVTVSITVVDELGSVERSTVSVEVGVGPVTALVAATVAPLPSVLAGGPVALSWQAHDAAGEVVPDYDSAAEVELTEAGTDVPGWVNTSSGAPLASPLPGWFNVPATAWSNGSLNLSVTATVAGTVDAQLTVAARGSPSVATYSVSFGPDVDHLRLFDPWVAESGPRSGATLWHVSDRFGNPAWGADLFVTAAFGASTITTAIPVAMDPDDAAVAWVNFSAPGASAGTVTVRDAAGDLLLAPVSVGSVGPTAIGSLPVMALVPSLALAVGAGVVVVRSRRARAGAARPVDEEAELRRLAEGREHVVAIVRALGPVDLAGLASAWEPPPAPADLSDWVASLLTDNTLGAEFGDDGVPRFVLTPEAEEPPRIELDPAALERAELARDAATGEEDP